MSSDRLRKGSLQYTKMSLVLLFFYLLWGDFVLQLMETVIPALMPLQLKELGASNTVMGLLLATTPAFFNLTINPVVSFRSDNFRSAWGRRIPFLMVFTPLVTIVLVVLSFSPEIGAAIWKTSIVQQVFGSPNVALIAVMAVCVVVFQFFHFCLMPVYYYLFVDVVPDAYMARFMALFRVVIAINAYLFNTFIYGHALTHTREIYVGCALVYCIGFMWMCWKVKEGKYPPPAHGERLGIWGSIKVYARECYSHPHYLLFNARNAVWGLGMVPGIYIIFVLRDELGLSLDFIGKINGWTALITASILFPMGMLCDRFGAIRIVLIAMCLHTAMHALPFFFLHGKVSFVVLQMIGLPIGALVTASELPFYATIPPRERYGQFGSANQLVISFVTITGSIVAGRYMDWITDGGKIVANYRYLYWWIFTCFVIATVLMYFLYRSWLKYGGPKNYVPPTVSGK